MASSFSESSLLSSSSVLRSNLRSVIHQRRSSYTDGILLLLVVVILWTASNFLTNSVLTSGYDKPFFVTYANTSSFALYLLPFFFSQRLRTKWKITRSGYQQVGSVEDQAGNIESRGWLQKLGFDLPKHTGFSTPSDTDDQDRYKPVSLPSSPLLGRVAAGELSDGGGGTTLTERSRTLRTSVIYTHPPRPSSIDGRRPRTEISLTTEPDAGEDILPCTTLPPLTLRETAILAAQFTAVWFSANWCINAGLGLTSVASGTTIGSASGFFTLSLGTLLGVDHFTVARFSAVSMSFLGVLLVTWADTGSSLSPDTPRLSSLPTRALDHTFSSSPLLPSNAPLGDSLALLSAFFYAVYVMLLKIKIGSEDRISMPLMFGMVGFFNILCLWPIGVFLHLTDLEPFQFPYNFNTWISVIINMSITLVSDLVYLMAMLKSSPLASTLGLSLTIPLAVSIDFLKGSHSGGFYSLIGSVMVLSSFVAIGIDDQIAIKKAEFSSTSLSRPDSILSDTQDDHLPLPHHHDSVDAVS